MPMPVSAAGVQGARPASGNLMLPPSGMPGLVSMSLVPTLCVETNMYPFTRRARTAPGPGLLAARRGEVADAPLPMSPSAASHDL